MRTQVAMAGAANMMVAFHPPADATAQLRRVESRLRTIATHTPDGRLR